MKRKMVAVSASCVTILFLVSTFTHASTPNASLGFSFNVQPGNYEPKWFQYSYGYSYTETDAKWYADRNITLVIGNDQSTNLQTWVKQYNPAAAILFYYDVFRTAPPQGNFQGDEIYRILDSGGIETAFLHNGTPISKSNRLYAQAYILGTYLMNPADPAYQRLLAEQAISVTSSGRSKYHNYAARYYDSGIPFEGIFLDEADGFYSGFLSEHGSPVEYNTSAQWTGAMHSLWRAISSAIPSKLTIPNTGTTFDGVVTGIAGGNANGWGDEFAPCAGQGCVFGWDAKSTILNIITITKSNPIARAFLRTSDALSYQANGISLERGRILALSLFYITAHNPNTYLHLLEFGYGDSPTSKGNTYNATRYELNLGMPVADTLSLEGIHGHIFLRLFERGIVVSKYQRNGNGNGDTTAEIIPLNGTVTNLMAGGTTNAIQLRNGEAFIGGCIGACPRVELSQASQLVIAFSAPLLVLAAIVSAVVTWRVKRPSTSLSKPA